MAHLKKANHGKTAMVTNSKNEIAALDSILKNLSDLGLGSEAEITPESSNFGTILNHPIDTIEFVVIPRKEISELKQQNQEEKEIKNQLWKCKDDLDEKWQRQLKGNLILSCQKPKPRIQSIIKTDDQLGNNSISDHCIRLVKQKYNVQF